MARRASDRPICVIRGGQLNGAAVCGADARSTRAQASRWSSTGDFACATTRREFSKLIHTGLPDLTARPADARVPRAVAERERFASCDGAYLCNAPSDFCPHLSRRAVRPPERWEVGLCFATDLARAELPRTERIETLICRRQTRETRARLAREGRTGAALYYDAWADRRVRITLPQKTRWTRLHDAAGLRNTPAGEASVGNAQGAYGRAGAAIR